MSRIAPAFPPVVAAALQERSGSVTVRYTLADKYIRALPPSDLVLMSTEYGRVLASISLDTKRQLRFVRTGDAGEGVRVARTDARPLLESGRRHWQITLTWDPDAIAVEAEACH
jgi:hypothetical protein